MFAVDHILVSDALAEAPFACNLGACLGGCCVQGDSGAPLASEERGLLEALLPKVRKYLTPEALAIIEAEGVWEETAPGHYAITCVGNDACVFVTYEGPKAKCAIHKAYTENSIDFPKPISCHLFPIRVQRSGDHEVLNYEQIPLCNSARTYGHRKNIQLADFLREPLTRKYGEAWYKKFQAACKERRTIKHSASKSMID